MRTLCPRCNKMTGDGVDGIHTCTPPAIVLELEAKLAQANREREVSADHYVVELRHWQKQVADLTSQLGHEQELFQAVDASRDELEAELDMQGHTVAELRERAEQAEAKVAALAEALQELVAVKKIKELGALIPERMAEHERRKGPAWVKAGKVLDDLPAAAQRLLAAQRVAEAIDADLRAGKIAVFDLGHSTAAHALDVWRYPDKAERP